MKFKESNREGIILIPDRTYTYQGIIGVESDVSKVENIYTDNCNVVYGIGSGSGPLITAYFNFLRARISADFERIIDHLVDSYNDVIVQKIKNYVLGPLGILYDPVNVENYTNNPTIFNMINARVNEVWNNLDILVGTIKNNKISIHNINSSVGADLTTQGFGVIGTGSNSALWTLIHLGYSPNSDMKTVLTLGLFAKFQSEESHGVGEATDVIVVYSDKGKFVSKVVDENTLTKIREKHKELINLQREKVKEAVNLVDL
ncbi:hypothetical protein [Metallosphaera hakonensis]|uniref:hypothetical protein n=1 Tax=Metallosphaera hakonensis TaxID=79601 RepID=UPI001F0D1C6C|nr:hypothetical protein [Metallosphaera hakonensis]